MKVVKVEFSAKVFAVFVEKTDRAFGVEEGLPEGSKLEWLSFKKDKVIAVFSHNSFNDVPKGESAPTVEIKYSAFQRK
ncbi:MAG: hypothetical protein KKD18_03270 [Nanoarchaeota archaeon]|nr:hypothetical protein [Nanoarchaeota archaeon]